MMYKILVAEDENSADEATALLENMVNEYLQNGWQMQGGVSLVYDATLETYSAVQAMIKEKNK